MKNCKNIIIAAIAAISAFSLAGCAGSENSRPAVSPDVGSAMQDYYASSKSSEQTASSSSIAPEPVIPMCPNAPASSVTATSVIDEPVIPPCPSAPASSSKASSSSRKPASSSKASSSSRKPASSSKASSSSRKPASSSNKPASSKPVVNAKDNSVEAIAKICGLKSNVEKNESPCWVDVFDEHNPYDVEYNYGAAYDSYIDKCDWSLVFDADYYIEQFPLLAMQYHNDKALLLEHFQTVGVHEGKQGSAKFNVGAYKANCNSKIRNAFGDNYEGYYFYYMMNSSEKSVNTTSGSNLKKQYKSVMTAVQANELAGINKYRSEVNVAPVVFNSELAAFANFRAWVNVHDGWEAHDWLQSNLETVYFVNDQLNGAYFSENICQIDAYQSYGKTYHNVYRNSPAHYQGMIKSASDTSGTSNVYTRNRDYGKSYQCDLFTDVR